MTNQPGLQLGHLVSSQRQDVQARLAALPACPMRHARCCVWGPPCSGKTSMLFHYSYMLAAAGERVLYLCRKAKLELSPPLLPGPGVCHADPAFARIGIKYIDGLGDLKRLGACLHLMDQPPAALVIDDIADLAAASTGLQDKRIRDAATTQALAYLVDGLEALGRAKGGEVQLLVSDSSHEAQPSHLVQRWFPLTVLLTGTPPGGLSLQLAGSAALRLPPQLQQLRCRYSITSSYLDVQSLEGWA